MIKFKDGHIDNRPVVDLKRRELQIFAVVADHEDFVEVCIDDSFNWSPGGQIFGGPLTEAVSIDADKDTLIRYKYHLNRLIPGDLIEIVGGRKMVGEVKTISGFHLYYVNKKIEVPYTDFTDGTSVQTKYVKLLNPKRENNEHI